MNKFNKSVWFWTIPIDFSTISWDYHQRPSLTCGGISPAFVSHTRVFDCFIVGCLRWLTCFVISWEAYDQLYTCLLKFKESHHTVFSWPLVPSMKRDCCPRNNARSGLSPRLHRRWSKSLSQLQPVFARRLGLEQISEQRLLPVWYAGLHDVCVEKT